MIMISILENHWRAMWNYVSIKFCLTSGLFLLTRCVNYVAYYTCTHLFFLFFSVYQSLMTLVDGFHLFLEGRLLLRNMSLCIRMKLCVFRLSLNSYREICSLLGVVRSIFCLNWCSHRAPKVRFSLKLPCVEGFKLSFQCFPLSA